MPSELELGVFCPVLSAVQVDLWYSPSLLVELIPESMGVLSCLKEFLDQPRLVKCEYFYLVFGAAGSCAAPPRSRACGAAAALHRA